MSTCPENPRFIDNLVDDVLILIFQTCLPVLPTADLNYPSILSLEGPVALTHICQRWRDVALSTPTLWRNIRINFLNEACGTPVDDSVVEECLRTWVNRAGSMTLYVDLFAQWIPVGSRTGYYWSDDDALRYIFDAVNRIIPWGSVVYLGMQGLGVIPRHYRNVLKQCSQLESLTILRFNEAFDILIDHVPLVHLPFLQHLVVNIGLDHYSYNPDDISDNSNQEILKYYTTPNLASITLELTKNIPVSHLLPVFYRFLVRNPTAKIRSFSLIYLLAPLQEDIMTLLVYLPTLRSLSFAVGSKFSAKHHQLPYLTKPMFQKLQADRAVPLLRRLIIPSAETDQMHDSDFSAAFDFIENRRLEDVRMKLTLVHREYARNRLAVMAFNGFDISRISIDG